MWWCNDLGGIAAGGGDVGASNLNGLGVWRTKFAKAVELSKGAGLAAFKAGEGDLDGEGCFVGMSLVEAEAEVGVENAILALVLSLVIPHGFILDGSFYDVGAANAPFGDGNVLDQVEFEEIGGLEGIDIALLELGEKLLTFCAEDDSSGGKAVFNGVLRGTFFAFRSDWAAGFCSVAARRFCLRFSAHEFLLSCD